MHEPGLLQQAFIFLLAGVVSVPIAKRLGLGSVLGYLLAGTLIGPYVLGWVGHDIHDVMHFAEFGVVMMLFLVGLELRPQLLWQLKIPILGTGGLQVLITAVALTAIGCLFGLPWQSALAIGMILALSSTAIVLQTLAEKGWMKTPAGKSGFSVLLFQDIAVIPMLAVLPLLAVQQGDLIAGGQDLSGWQQALMVVGVVVGIIIAGRFLTRPLFRVIAETRLREMFTATALFIVVGIALLMEQIGLSAALGTFLAGVVLANNEYRHELEAEIEPFKGLLLGLFFISVGASIDFLLLAEAPFIILGLTVGLLLLKMGVLYLVGTWFGISGEQRWLFTFSLAQGGEFAFVLFSFANQHHILNGATTAPLIVAVALSMVATPVLMIVYEKKIASRYFQRHSEPVADQIDYEEAPVILAGYGRFGQVVGRLLRLNGFAVTVLEHSAAQVDLVRKFGHEVYYGDASRLDLLQTAGAEHARLMVVAIDDTQKTQDILQTCRKHFPHLQVIARAAGRREAQQLLAAGADHVTRELFHSGLSMGMVALNRLGMRRYQAQRAANIFKHHDEAHLHQLTGLLSDEKKYVSASKRNQLELEKVLNDDLAERQDMEDHAWEVPSGQRSKARSGNSGNLN